MDMLKALRTRHVAALALALAVAACGSEDGKKPTTRPTDGDDGDGQGDGDGDEDGTPADGSDGTPADGGDGAQDGDPSEAAELPFAVDNVYAVSGFMGAGNNPDVIVASPNDADMDATCGDNRPADAVYGHCHTFVYTPDPLGEAWAGVFWQFPEQNWTGPGLAIEPGATEVSFQLRADAPVVLKFVAGMASTEGMGAEEWKRETDAITATTTWTKHKIDLTGLTYTTVTGAFAWTIENMAQTGANAAGPFKFYIDDIAWK